MNVTSINRINWAFAIVAFLLLFNQNQSFSQDPLRLKAEVDHLDSMVYSLDVKREIILFTGSSSIRKWENISNYFPDHQIINTGFGGSQMSDLIFYIDQLIINYKPDKVFIYEGDNDIAYGKTIDEIILATNNLVDKLQKLVPDIEIVFISAKPSLARWDLKEEYLVLNDALKALCENRPKVYFADVWNIMIGSDGKPRNELFVNDGLHMTVTGYELWAKELDKYLK